MSATRLKTPLAAVSLSVVALLGVSACSDGSDDDASPTTTEAPAAEGTTDATATPEDDEDTEDETTTTEADGDEGSGGSDGEVASWAEPYETPGELLTTIEGEGFKVDVYQVGTATSPKDGMFVDPDTNEPTLAEGDELVFMNYVFTNTGDETIPLSYSLAEVNATYADWPYLGGMDSITDRDLWEEMGVLSTTITPGGSDAPFLWEPGTTFAAGDNFLYQPGGPITFEARLTPVDEDGELLSEERQEIEVESTIV